MRKLLFAEYTDLNQAKFKDAKDIRTFTKICIDTYNGTTYATQMENGTFEQWNKAKIIDKVCGTRFDLKM